ncbi:MAG: hypothetical protein DDT32_00302 [Syntrophomonadaceae bacterium]|nr:hypothetical protein [Bacillota bacterium]
MDAFFNGIIFCRQPESIVSHRFKYPESLHFFISCPCIRRTIVIPVPNMQFIRGRIVKHNKTVVLVPLRMRSINPVRAAFFPPPLPLCFNLFKRIHNQSHLSTLYLFCILIFDFLCASVPCLSLISLILMWIKRIFLPGEGRESQRGQCHDELNQDSSPL